MPLALLLAVVAASPKPLRVALPPIQVVGDVPPRVAQIFSDSLPTELRKLENVWAVSHAELADILSIERQKQLLGCSEAESATCLAELAGALNVDELVTVSLTLLGNTYTMSWKRTDARKMEVRQAATKQFDKGNGEEVLAMVGVAIESMYPDRALKAGRTRGIDSEVSRRLNPPPLPRWLFGVTLGAGAVAAGIGTTFRLLGNSSATSFRALADSSTANPVSGMQLALYRADAERNALNATILWCVASGLVVVAIIEALFTDWHPAQAVTP